MSAQSKDTAANSLMMAACVNRQVSLPPPTPIISRSNSGREQREWKTTEETKKRRRDRRKEDFCSLNCQWFEHRGENNNLDKGKERVNL